jgi:hypothetical protein
MTDLRYNNWLFNLNHKLNHCKEISDLILSKRFVVLTKYKTFKDTCENFYETFNPFGEVGFTGSKCEDPYIFTQWKQ